MTRALIVSGIVAVTILLLSSCSNVQSALAPRGKASADVLDLFWIFLAVCTLVWLLVMAALLYSLLRRRRDPIPVDPLAESDQGHKPATIIVGACVALTAVILVVLTMLSFFTGKSLADLTGDEPLTVQVTGHQWWWEVRYEDAQPSRSFTTANEIHIPIGTRVKVKLASTDVIHSFWVPSLAPKRDLIPGRYAELTLVADRPGVYRGQCAEFCGFQHAHMGLLVVAEPKEDFEAWRDRQIASAAAPSSDEARRGQQVFLSKGCVMCHAVRGTPAGGRVAPDLTHVGSRRTLAAGTLPMTRGALAAWIADPQALKPGANMPRVDLTADELNAVVSYVEGLK